MNLKSGPGIERNIFVDPALVRGGVILGVTRLAGKFVPVWLDVRLDVDLTAIPASTACGEVIPLHPVPQTGGNLGVGIGESDDVRLEIAVQKLLGVLNLQLFAGLV